MEIFSSLGVHWQSLLAQAVNFAVIAFVLYKFAIKPALISLDERVKKQEDMEKNADTIDARLKEAEETRKQVLAEAREAGKKLIEEAEANAKSLSEKLNKDAQHEAQKIVSEAKKQMTEEREVLYKDIKREISSLVSIGIEKTIGKYVDSSVQSKMTSEATEEISKLNLSK